MAHPYDHRRFIVACDPGCRESGVVARSGRDLLGASLVMSAAEAGALPDARYVAEVLAAIAEYRERGGLEAPAIVAVEAVTKPNTHHDGQLRFITPIALIGTAIVYGAILGVYPDAVVVQPGGHGQAPMVSYPEILRPTSGQGKGYDKRRHVRSAWDIAGAAALSTGLATAR